MSWISFSKQASPFLLWLNGKYLSTILTFKVLLVRREERERATGDKYREELRQVRNSGARVGTRGRFLARAHQTRSRSPCANYP